MVDAERELDGTNEGLDDPFQLRERPPLYSLGLVVDEKISNDSLCSACQSIFDQQHEFDSQGRTKLEDLYVGPNTFKNGLLSNCYICSLIKQRLPHASKNGDAKRSEQKLPMSQVPNVGILYQVRQDEFHGLGLNFCAKDDEGNQIFKPILRLTMFYVPEIESILHPLDISDCVQSERNLALIQHWLHSCDTEHELCSLPQGMDRSLPTRLIEIESVSGKTEVRLRDGEDLPLSTQYLSLSHCWGTKPIFTLRKGNLESLRESIETTQLTKTFQDAIWLTEAIGFKYLWIDSLCIIQDALDDWLQEAPQMGKVYRNATCNIAGTGFSDGQEGIFASRDANLLLPLKIYADWGGHTIDRGLQLRGQYYLLDSDLWRDSVPNAPLNSRGWVVQERTSSPRIIHFGHQQLFWECYVFNGSEAFPNGFNGRFDTGNQLKNVYFKNINYSEHDRKSFILPQTYAMSVIRPGNTVPDRHKLYDFWRTVITTYSSTQLTHSRDKLPAISGIAKELSIPLKDRYIAGMWEGDLLRSLLWMVATAKTSDNLPAEYRAPTWSWASVDVTVLYSRALTTRHQEFHNMENLPEEVVHSSILEVGSDDSMTGHDGKLGTACTLKMKGAFRRVMKVSREWNPIMLMMMDRMMVISLMSWFIEEKEVKITIFQDTYPDEIEGIMQFGFSPRSESSSTMPFVRPKELCISDKIVTEIFILPLISCGTERHMFGLVLLPTGRERGEFFRIGAFKVSQFEDQETILAAGQTLDQQLYEELDEIGDFIISIV